MHAQKRAVFLFGLLSFGSLTAACGEDPDASDQDAGLTPDDADTGRDDTELDSAEDEVPHDLDTGPLPDAQEEGLGCVGILDCFNASDRSVQSLAGCTAQGTPTGRALLDALSSCVDENCASEPTDEGFATCQRTLCARQLQACVQDIGTPPPIVACGAEGDPCNSDAQSREAYACDVSARVCRPRCATTEAASSDGTNCATGSYCFATEGRAVPRPGSQVVLNGVCRPGDCERLFDEGACEGVVPAGGGSRCTSDSCTCVPIANDASFCQYSGSQGVGESCGRSADGGFGETCVAGLLCAQGFCVAPCDLSAGPGGCSDTSSTHCPDGVACDCIAAFAQTQRNRPGVCAQECDPFDPGRCPDGTTCQPQFDVHGVNAWMCAALAIETPVAAGQPCEQRVGNRGVCEDGYLCTSPLGSAQTVCMQTCDLAAEIARPGASCSPLPTGSAVCLPTGVGDLSLCYESCDPYPRTGGGGYGCSDPSNTCATTLQRRDGAVDVVGYCIRDAGRIPAYGNCTAVGQLAGDCADRAACLYATRDAIRPQCLPLCEPFSTEANACEGDATCAGLWILSGNYDLAYCEPPRQPGNAFERCNTIGTSCAGDGTICLRTTAAPDGACLPVCREGFNDCARYPGRRTCVTGTLEGVLSFMGVCV